MTSSRDGRLWLGTQSGLYFVTNSRNLQRVEHSSLLNVQAVLEARSGGLWIGTGDGALFRYGSEGVRKVDISPDMPPRSIVSLHESSDGSLWLGTDSGLRRYAAGWLVTFGPDSGVPQRTIHGLLEDEFGRLWINHDGGVSRTALLDLEAWLRDKSHAPVVSHFGSADGILNLEGVVGSPSCAKTADGRLWFAKKGGLIVVDPAECPADGPVPQVWIEGLEANGTIPISRDASVLPPGSGRQIEILFTATSLHSPERVEVFYQLEGHDASWRSAGLARRASYSNLRPGTYRFRVKARNHEGRWSEREALLGIIIQPFLWQTWGFRIDCGLALIVGVGGVFQWRLQRQRRQLLQQQDGAIQDQRNQIARDLHDHVGARLAEASFATKQSENPVSDSRSALSELKDLVWSVHPENDTLSSLGEFITDFSSRFLTAAGLKFDLDVPLDLPPIAISGCQRNEVAAMFKEALRNIVQHARATRVNIQMRVEGNLLIVRVGDDGCGFAPALGVRPSGGSVCVNAELQATVSPSGNGLCNFHARCADLGGSCRIESATGLGTRVEFTIPLDRKSPTKPKRWFRW